MVKYGLESLELIRLSRLLDKASSNGKSGVYKRVAELLRKRNRLKNGVNLLTLEKHCNAGETAVVPDRLLSLGKITKKLTVAAISVSKPAAKKLQAAGCTVISIKQLIEQNPTGKGIRIII